VGKKVVLLTGGAGFIGSHTAQALLRRGDDVVVIDDFNDYYDPAIKRSNVELLKAQAAMSGGMNAPELTVYAGSITDTKLMASIFADHAVSHVCHLAARAGVRPSIDDPLLYVDTNITGTTVLLELARKHGVANFVYASSSSVYGGSKSAYFSEDEDVSNPVSQ
jgi:UDP-glucuronate 4-epimerase